MPIVNYAALAEQAEKDFFSNAKISDKNKAAMRRYLQQYDVAAATRLKFLKHIVFLLAALDEIEKQMHDRELINKTFNKFRKEIKPGYLGTVINVSKAFTRWLNDGDKPKGFKDIKSVGKKDQQRNLSPQDMWTWDDGKEFGKHTSSVQIRAAIMTQLDAGFRPSEFIDLNYGDVTIKGDIVFFHVRNGKTGKREVSCKRCVPYFLDWYKTHPTKRRDDPLWVMEFAEKSHPQVTERPARTRRYEYAALKKRVMCIAARARIRKPYDFYTLRHSSCTLDKRENLPLDLAAARHGHTVEYFTEIYGRLDLDGTAERMRKHYADETEKRCERCDHINKASLELCEKCQMPLTVKKAMEIEQGRNKEIANIKAQYDKLVSQLKIVSPVLNKLTKEGRLR